MLFVRLQDWFNKQASSDAFNLIIWDSVDSVADKPYIMVKTQGSRSETTRSLPLTAGISYLSGILNKLFF